MVVKTFWVSDGHCGVEITAATAKAAIDDFVEGYDDVDTDGDEVSTSWATITAIPLGLDGEPSDDPMDRESRRVTIEPDVPNCLTGQGHKWEDRSTRCSSGGGVLVATQCVRCGLTHHHDTWAQDPATGEEGLVADTYKPAEDGYLTKIEVWAEGCPMPLFEKYEGQHEHQPAHIALRRDGSAVMGYDSVVGGGVPGDGWHGHTLRWDVSPMLTAAECEELATNTEVLELLRRTHYGHSIELDKSGSNMVGVLDSDATEASNDLTALLEKIEGTGQPWDIGDWWGDGGDKPMVREGESVRDAAARLVAEAHEDDDVYLIGGVDAVERFIEENQEDDR